MLIVEDLTRDIIETLGSNMQIDPDFFAYHLYEARSEIETLHKLPYLLPSTVRQKGFICFKYVQTLSFNTCGVPPPSRLITRSNVRRKVSLSIAQGALANSKYSGNVLRKVSLMKVARKGGAWQCVVLVDPPIGNSFLADEKGLTHAMPIYLAQTELVQGGYVDFSPCPTFSESLQRCSAGPLKVSMLEDLVHYWENGKLPGDFARANPSLLSLSFYPLRIAASELLNVAKSMQQFIETYERAVEKHGAELTILDKDLRHIYTFRRRLTLLEQNCQQIIQLSRYEPQQLVRDCQMDWIPATIQDFEFLEDQFRSLGLRAERTIPMITSLVQILEGRQSFQETTNISRLTNLALVFMPLSFTASLFSMGCNVGPGSSQFWIYFAVAVPLLLLTFSSTIWNQAVTYLRHKSRENS